MKQNKCEQCKKPSATTKWTHGKIQGCPIGGCCCTWFHDHLLCETCRKELENRKDNNKRKRS